MTPTRRLPAILAADVAGYPRLMGADKEGTLERLRLLRGEDDPPAPRARHPLIQETPASATGARERAGARRYRVGRVRRAGEGSGWPGAASWGKPGETATGVRLAHADEGTAGALAIERPSSRAAAMRAISLCSGSVSGSPSFGFRPSPTPRAPRPGAP